MTSRPGHVDERALLVVLLGLFCCRALFASVVVPPWQGPDDPVHFAMAYRLAAPGDGDAARGVERDVIRSMASYRWWEPYGSPAPDPLPVQFEQIRRFGRGRLSQPLYYGIGAGVLRLTGTENVETAFWMLRGVSVALSVLALTLGWLGTRLLFGGAIASGALAIACLHPQFLLTAMTVNPDALLNVFGAFIWWQVARASVGHRPQQGLVLAVTAALLAPFVKRSGLLISGIGLLWAVGFAAPRLRLTRRVVLFATAGVGITALVAVAVVTLFRSQVADIGVYWRNALLLTRAPAQMGLSDVVTFAGVVTDYAWLVAGWLRFPAPDAWLWVARLVTMVGFASAVLYTLRAEALQKPLRLAWLFFGGQVVTTVVVAFVTLGSPQGRLMFPVIAPTTALLWIGLTNAVPATARAWAPVMVVALMAMMDVTGLTTTLMPAYLPWG